jgi:hypothetical protein
MPNDNLDDLTVEGFLGMVLTVLKGPIPPPWMTCNEEAKQKYITKGKAAFEAFKRDEMTFKEAREAGNPRAFFFE